MTWKPVNPYAVPEGVSFQEAVNIEQQNKYEYMAFLEGVEAGQRKLLEYQLNKVKQMKPIVDNRDHRVITSADMATVDKNYAGVVRIFLKSGYSIVIGQEEMKEIIKKVESET